MPKISKATKAKKADFAKTKLKVGKQKAQADNVTDTSFKSKSISLPSQSLNQKHGSQSSHFSHQLALIGHKSGDTRKDALMQLTQTLRSNPPVLSTVLTPLMHALAPLIIDDMAAVRRVLLELMKDVLASLPGEVLSPHTTLLLLYISAAMTHITPSIRADSTKFLSWAMLHSNATEVILESQLGKFMDNFSTLCGWRGTNSTLLSSKSLVVHLEVFERLMRAALIPPVVEARVVCTHDVKVVRDLFIPHKSTEALLGRTRVVQIFGEVDELEGESGREGHWKVIEPRIKEMMKYMEMKFSDTVHGNKELCLPIIQLMNLLLESGIEGGEAVRHARKKISLEIEHLKELGGIGAMKIAMAFIS